TRLVGASQKALIDARVPEKVSRRLSSKGIQGAARAPELVAMAEDQSIRGLEPRTQSIHVAFGVDRSAVEIRHVSRRDGGYGPVDDAHVVRVHVDDPRRSLGARRQLRATESADVDDRSCPHVEIPA